MTRIALLVLLLLSACATQPTQAPTVAPIPTKDRYASCIDWSEAGAYDGKAVCVTGRIVDVKNQHDDDPEVTRAYWSKQELEK